MKVLIHLKAVCKNYQMGQETVHALDGINLDIERNEYVAIIGSSGSGKSTLMNIIGCLDTPSSGDYWLNNRKIDELSADQLATIRNREIGFIFQSFNLLPRLSTIDNVMRPLIYQGIPLGERRQRAVLALQKVGLADRLEHMPNQLSGGQRQRVAIARALVTQPSILLADEPTGNLDTATSKEIMSLFDELHSQGQTIIMVTHELDIADHCLRKIQLQDGKIIKDQSTQIPTHV